MGLLYFDLKDLYAQTFGGQPYVITEPNTSVSQLSGSTLVTEYLGKEIWLPIKFIGLDPTKFLLPNLLLPYAAISLSSQKTIVRTPMSERKGTVKELYNVDDWQMTIRGFLIDDTARVFPEVEMKALTALYDLQEAIRIDNALTNIALEAEKRVVITKLSFPEVVGGRKHIRPFSMSLESDTIFSLESIV